MGLDIGPLLRAFFFEKVRNERIGRHRDLDHKSQCERLYEQYVSSLEKAPIPLVPGLKFSIDNRRNKTIAIPIGHSAMSDGWLARLTLWKSRWMGILSQSEAGGMYVLVLMMGFNNAVREEEMNGWTERCLED